MKALFEYRNVAALGPIGRELTAELLVDLLLLDHQSPGEPITLWINSPGGDVAQLLALVDTVELLGSPVATIAVGQAWSAAAILLACGAPGRRFITEHATVMVHRGEINAAGVHGCELAALGQHYESIEARVADIIAARTQTPIAAVRNDAAGGLWLGAAEAVAYGFADEILTSGRHPWS